MKEQTTRQQVALLIARAKQTCEVAEGTIHGKQVTLIPNGYVRSYGKRHLRLRAKIDGENYAYSQTATHMLPELVLKLDPVQVAKHEEARQRYEAERAQSEAAREAERVRMQPVHDRAQRAITTAVSMTRDQLAGLFPEHSAADVTTALRDALNAALLAL